MALEEEDLALEEEDVAIELLLFAELEELSSSWVTHPYLLSSSL
jgi:hypothetical protein